MKAAGYNVVYKGKWHCSKPAGAEATPADLEKYGFLRWNPPDAGANQTVPEAGGGFIDNDGRFIESEGSVAAGTEGALQYLGSTAAQQQPFFMVVSLVNPHDVLFYPQLRPSKKRATTTPGWRGASACPRRVEEDLSTKPSVQEQFLRIFNLTGKPRTTEQKRNYLNFYGNLMRSSDNYLVDVLDKLEETGLFDNTLVIRTADHGEMGLAHGGLRQKNFNFYEESLCGCRSSTRTRRSSRSRPAPTRSSPTSTSCRPWRASPRRRESARANWQGVDYSSLVLRPTSKRSAQDYIVFTYDDFQSGQASGPYPKPPNHIVSIREGALEAGQVLRRRTQEAAAVGDVRPEDGPAGEDEPRRQGLRAHARAAEAVPAPQTQARPGREDAAAAALGPRAASRLRGGPDQ